MRTRKMRLVSALLALAMMFLLMPVAAFADGTVPTPPALEEGEFDYDGLRYKKLNDAEVSVVGPVSMWDGDLVIPDEASDGNKTYLVTEIADHAFDRDTVGKYKNFIDGSKELSVTIPKTVVKIGNCAFRYGTYWNDRQNGTGLLYVTFETGSQLKTIDFGAFAGCYNLKKIEIPSEVETIGENAFWDCQVETIDFQEGSKLQSIPAKAFHWNTKVKYLKIPEGVKTIGGNAFVQFYALETLVLPGSIEEIDANAFSSCSKLETVVYNGTKEQLNELIQSGKVSQDMQTKLEAIQKSEHLIYLCDVNFNMNGHGDAIEKKQVYVKENVAEPAAPTADGYAFEGWYKDEALTEKFDFANEPVAADMTLYAKWEKIPADLTVSTEKLTCTVGETAAMEFAVVTNGDAGSAATASLTVSDPDAVDSLKVNGQTMKDKGFTYSFSHLIGMTGKVEAVFNKAGTYTMTATLAVDGNEPVVRTVEVTVKEKPVEPVATYDLTVKDGKVKVDGNSVNADEKGVYEVAENAKVEVTFDRTTLSDAQVFDQWTIAPASVLDAVDPKAETIRFTMPAEKVTIEAMTRDATIESDGPGVLGTAAMIGVGVAGTAVLGYQGYMIGTELYLKYAMPAWAAIPQTRGQLALLLWQDADRPEPAEKTPYADMNEADAEEQQAARWVVEKQLMEAAKDADDSFAPDAPVSRWEIIRSWNRAQELKNN